MAALDTNVVLRLVVGDDPKQARAAEKHVAAESCTVAPSVLMECEWVLRGSYKLDAALIAASFRDLLALQNIDALDPVPTQQALQALRGRARLRGRAARGTTARWRAVCHLRSPARPPCAQGRCAGRFAAEDLSRGQGRAGARTAGAEPGAGDRFRQRFPVRFGLAASLQRPGGNVTGLVIMYDDIRPKLFQLARQLAPKARRFGAMYGNFPGRQSAQVDAVLESGRQLARQVNAEYLPLPVRDPSGIEAAIASLTPAPDHVLLVNSDGIVVPHFEHIAALARATKLPSASQGLSFAPLGGLMSYGPDLRGNGRRAVQLADKVLRGERVGDIPIEQPTLIRLVLNQRTAGAIGLTLPQELLLRADEVIE